MGSNARNVLTRRSFVKAASVAAGAAWASSPGARAEPAPTDDAKPLPKNWLWMRPGVRRTDDDWKRLFERAKKVGVDAVVPEVYNGADAFFEHPSPLVRTRANVLEKMIPLAHEAGVQVHAWMWTMPCNNPRVVREHTDWYAVNGLGEPANKKPAYVGYYKFLCPRQPQAQEFIEGNAAALAQIADLDGVHLDYVRLPDVILAKGLWDKYGIVQDREYPQYDYCYCSQCRKEFKELTGADPLKDLRDPAADELWRQYRYDGVSQLVKSRLAPQAREHGKAISAAVFPNWRYVRQEWHTWGLDAYLPMLYHSFYDEGIEWIGEEVRRALRRFDEPSAVYAGLFVPALNDESFKESLVVAREAGASGVALFDEGALREHHWTALAESL